MGALIIALGLLADDAIIVVESMMVKLEQGSDRINAAGYAFASTAGPRLTGALVTSAGFIPMGLTQGTVGELLGSMFWVVAMALLISWIVAGTATPLMGYHLIKVKPKAGGHAADLYDTKFYRLFKRILTWCLNHRKSVMISQPYLRDVNLDWNEKSKVIHLELDQDKARMLGVGSQSLALALQSQLSGAAITEFREEDRTVGMVFRLDAQNRSSISDVKDLNIQIGNGQYVPLDQVARISYDAEEGLLGRRDLKSSVNVQAKVGSSVTEIDATRRVYDSLKEIRQGLPPGYSIEVGGIKEMADLAIGYLLQNVPLMVLVIVILLMFQLRSMPKMFLTLLTAPMGIIGVGPVLLLTRQPLCFVVYCGALALSGIIIRNSIILIDQIEQQLKAGESAWNAIIHAAVQRFRPIMLTAAAAILGMIPLSTSVLWGPMAVAIAGGLFIATLLTLLVLPTMYAAWFRVKPE